MTRPETSIAPDYFESMFLGDNDPWNLESSAYEQAKYDHTIHALPGRTYARGFEVGCAKGVLTSKLAPHCDTLFAIDVSGTALNAARRRCTPFAQVSFANMNFPEQTPDQVFDLIVLSEVAYYWSDRDIRRVGEWIGRHLLPGGDLLLVHWTGETDYPQSGDGALTKLRDALTAKTDVVTAQRCDHYRLDLWRKRACA